MRVLSGFNHNLRHKGILFHIQTEDSGDKVAQIVTHIFMGGNVIVTRRSSYKRFLDVKEQSEIVEAMMKEQHKDVMKDLVNGKFRAVREILRAHAPEAEEPPPLREEKISAAAEGPPQVAGSGSIRTLDTKTKADRTLDELILDFLSTEDRKKP